MKLFTLATIMTTTALTLSAQAQTPAPAGPSNSSTAAVMTSNKSSSNIVLGFKSFDDTGRAADLDTVGGRNAKSKNEAYLGYRFNSGWGGFYNVVQYYNSYYHNDTKTKFSQGDSSITLLHPDFYKSDSLIVFGQLRYYTPTTDRSIDKNINQFAYYFRLNAKFEGGQEIYNEFIPRYFGSTNYAKTDTTNYIEDTTIYHYKIDGTGWKVGAKSWAQYEEHAKTGTGYCLEAGPEASYSFNSNFSISPSIMLPLLQSNTVYDGPKAVGTDQAYLSIFVQAKL